MIHRSSSMWKGTKTLCKIRFVGTFQHTVSHCSKTGERESDSSHEGIVPLLFARDSAPGAVAAAVLLLPLPALRVAACLLAAVALLFFEWVDTSLQLLFGIRKHHDAGPDIGKRAAFN